MLVFLSDNFFINLIGNIFFIAIVLLLFVIIIAILTTIKIEYKYINKTCKLIIKLYILEKIRYLKIELDKTQLISIFEKVRIKVFSDKHRKIEKDIYQDRNVIKNIIKKLKINLEYLNVDLKLGTEFMLLTSVIIITISTIFPMIANKFIKKYDSKKYNYKFTPIYNKNDIKLQLHCIINIKLVHIINVIISIIFKKGVFKNVRTSNTRFNDNCYE